MWHFINEKRIAGHIPHPKTEIVISSPPYDAEPKSGDASAAISAASLDAYKAGGTLRIPAGTWYIDDTCHIGSPTSTHYNSGGRVIGAGGGPELKDQNQDPDDPNPPPPTGFKSSLLGSNQTILVWRGNDPNKSLMEVHASHPEISHILFFGGTEQDKPLRSFIQFQKVQGINTGKFHIHNCGFQSDWQKSDQEGWGWGVTGITTNDNNNEDESHIHDCNFYRCETALRLTDPQNIGWLLKRWRVTTATTAVRCESNTKANSGGKITMEQIFLNSESNPPPNQSMLSLGHGAITTSTYTLTNCYTDGGDNTRNVAFVTNELHGNGTNLGTINLMNCMARHTTQEVPLIQLGRAKGFSGVVNIMGGIFLRTCSPEGFARLQGKSAQDRAIVNVYGTLAVGEGSTPATFPPERFVTADSEHYEFNVHKGSKIYLSDNLGDIGSG